MTINQYCFGLAPNRRQVIIWTNGGLVYIYAWVGLDELTHLALNSFRNHIDSFYEGKIAGFFLLKGMVTFIPEGPAIYESSLVQAMTCQMHSANDDSDTNELTYLPIQLPGEVNTYHKQDMDI